MQRADDGDRRPLLDSVIEKGHLRIVEHDTPQCLGHQFVLNPVDFDLSSDGSRCRDLSRLPPELVASSIIYVGIVEDQGPVKLSLPLPALAADPISAFRGGAVALVLFFSNTIEARAGQDMIAPSVRFCRGSRLDPPC